MVYRHFNFLPLKTLHWSLKVLYGNSHFRLMISHNFTLLLVYSFFLYILSYIDDQVRFIFYLDICSSNQWMSPFTFLPSLFPPYPHLVTPNPSPHEKLLRLKRYRDWDYWYHYRVYWYHYKVHDFLIQLVLYVYIFTLYLSFFFLLGLT